MNKILVPTGYMGSGSSAVTDILAEIDGCSARNGDFEFVFLHCPNGVFDLEDKLLRGSERPSGSAKVLKLQFEDLVYDYDASMEQIYAFLGVTKAQHSAPRTHFDPAKSIQNTQLFRANEQYAREAEIIAELLPEYIYDFPYERVPDPEKSF